MGRATDGIATGPGRKETAMSPNDFMLSQLSREIIADRLREAEQSRRARLVAALRRLQPRKRQSPPGPAPAPRKAPV
jgi:hypothetical protein